jgi:ATPase subunit of ABC transporter with duplicated ATPase domains
MIMDELQADKGEFQVGETVKIGYVDQSHKDIHPDKTVFDVVSNGLEFVEVGNQKINIIR